MSTKEEKAITKAKASLKKKQEGVLREKVRLKNLERAAAIKERKRETRRKILQGSYLSSAWTPEEISTALDGYLTSPRDRELFGLPPILQDEDLVDTLPVNDPET